MKNPCIDCKRSKCPSVCKPYHDFKRALFRLARETGKNRVILTELEKAEVARRGKG